MLASLSRKKAKLGSYCRAAPSQQCIDLAAFRERTPKRGGKTQYYEVWPSQVEEAYFELMGPFLNAIIVNGALPSFLSEQPSDHSRSIASSTSVEVIQNVMKQSEAATSTAISKRAPNVAETKRKKMVDIILNSALWEVHQEMNVTTNPALLFNFSSETSIVEYAFRFDHTFLINGRSDTVISTNSPNLFPIQNSPSLLSAENLEIFHDKEQELLLSIDKNEWPGVLEYNGSYFSSFREGFPPKPTSSFVHGVNKPIPAPFLNVIIDDKAATAPLNRSQMALMLYASLASQARYRGSDVPSLAVGLVTDAARWSFIVFQLNTLNLDHETKNFIWSSECILYDSRTNAIDLEAYLNLKKLFRIATTSVLLTCNNQ